MNNHHRFIFNYIFTKNMQYFFLEHGRRREHNTFETNLDARLELFGKYMYTSKTAYTR